ncbi:MAG: translation initiation factor IF-2 associated domain-containing protein, partial [Pseudomonadota bacterium]
MSDDNKTPAGSRPKLSLKPRQPGTVRQNFSHGRTNSVVVETTKRRRIVKPGDAPAEKPVEAAPAPATPAPAPTPAPAARATPGAGAPVVPSGTSTS